ncbi:MAG: hypothetical protein WA892_05770 [Ornithinimicrobium sp.]
MRDRIAPIAPVAAIAGALGLCCGLPVLLSLGVVGAIAGWSLQSWALIGLGLALTAPGRARLVRGRRHDTSYPQPGAAPSTDAAAVETTDCNTDATTKENHR